MIVLFNVKNVAAQTTETFTTDQCTTPTQNVTISTIDHNNGVLGFTPNSIQVAKDACVRLALLNPSEHDHDFDISPTENPGMTLVHIEFSQTNATVYLNVQFPNKNMDVIFYCSVPGHRAAGMVGTFIVGTGTSKGGFLPGFELPITIAAFLSMIAVVPFIKKYKK